MSTPAPAANKPSVVTPPNKRATALQVKINQRQSKELVIAFSGPAGSGIRTTVELFRQQLETAGYTVVAIKLSKHIKDKFEKLQKTRKNDLPNDLQEVNINNLKGAERYETLQTIGNYLRQQFEPNILAQSAIEEILFHRIEKARPQFEEQNKKEKYDLEELVGYAIDQYIPPKTAYLIDQLKNPAEVELLRDVYGDLFYLVGTLCPERERKHNLLAQGMKEEEATRVMQRDRRENEDHGQQLEKTLQLSDYFIRNLQDNRHELENQIKRFINIIHRTEILTPTRDKHGMYVAHSAALRSACLSRQVGAAITDQSGQVIATGCNDVPKYGGGLYSANDKERDLRCYNKGSKCYNDDFKERLIRQKLQEILEKHHIQEAQKISEEMFRSTRIKDLIEFSRSIHAEMDALISVARKGGVSTKGCTMYTTTFPCHSCAGHIVAAGITRVVYIEPYEKSLAMKLHDDAISSEEPADNMVVFSHFEGVAPRRYQDFFLANEERKDEKGQLVVRSDYELKPKIHEYLDSYRRMEVKVYEQLKETGLASDA